MLLQIFLVLATFAMGSVGGLVFSRYYFASSGMGTTFVKFADRGAQRLFCVIFGACCNTLLLVLFEILGVLTYDFRLAALKTHIALLVLFMLCAVPSYHAYALFRTCMAHVGASIATAASQLVLIYTLMRLLPPWPGVPEPPSTGLFSLRIAVLRTGVLGVCAIGILAGFGTVAFPYSVLRAFVVPVNPYEVKALQTQLGLIREQINDKLERARLLDEQAAAMSRNALPRSTGAAGWLGGALSAIPGLGGSSATGGESLRQSAEALQSMEVTLAGDVQELVAEQQRARAASTLLGRVLDLLGYILAVYCVIKMVLCAKAAVFGEDFTSDPASRALSLLLFATSRGKVHVNLQATGQYVTLLFVGFVSFNSLRAFLTVLRQVSTYMSSLFFTVASGAPAASGGGATAAAERTILGLGALLCAYTVSSVMLVRAQLPLEHRLIVTSALGFDEEAANTELDAVHRWFNGTQLASLVVSLWLCYWKFKNKQANVMDLPSISSQSFQSV